MLAASQAFFRADARLARDAKARAVFDANRAQLEKVYRFYDAQSGGGGFSYTDFVAFAKDWEVMPLLCDLPQLFKLFHAAIYAPPPTLGAALGGAAVTPGLDAAAAELAAKGVATFATFVRILGHLSLRSEPGGDDSAGGGADGGGGGAGDGCERHAQSFLSWLEETDGKVALSRAQRGAVAIRPFAGLGEFGRD